MEYSPRVSLHPVDRNNIDRVLCLKTKAQQETFVAPVAYTLAQASTYDEAWIRAVYLDENPIGLIAMKIQPQKSLYYLWRMLIDEKYQQSGWGRSALTLVEREIRNLGGTQITIRIKPGANGPEGFYRKLGFQYLETQDGIDKYILEL